MEEFATLISNYGFPIAMCFLMVYGIYKISRYICVTFVKPIIERWIASMDKITKTNEKLAKTCDELVSTNNVLSTRILNGIDDIKQEIKEIKK